MRYLKFASPSGLLAGAVVGLLAGCKPTAQETTEALTVPVSTVAEATLANDLVLTAEFQPFQEVEVMAKVSGYVKEVKVDIGDHVHKGDVLAILEVPEIQDEMAKAEAALKSAEAASDIAALSYKRIRDVAERDQGLVPQQQVDVAQSHALQASAQLASARSEFARAQAMMYYSTIHAPFAGVITKRYANVGSMIQAGTSSQSQAMPVVRLAQNDVLRLFLPVPESVVAGVTNGLMVDINVVSLGLQLHYPVARHNEAVQMATRTMDAEVDVPNPDDKLVQGMYVEAHLHMKERPKVLSAPLDAVDGLGTSVQQAYVVKAGEIHIATVKTGLATPTRVEIVSGLQDGDSVVVGRHTGLYEGEKVTARAATYENSPSNH